MQIWGLVKTNIFSLVLHTKQLQFVTFCDTTAGIRSGTGCDADARRRDRHKCQDGYIETRDQQF